MSKRVIRSGEVPVWFEEMYGKAMHLAAQRVYEERDKYVRLMVRPKPRWLPQCVWMAVLNRLLFLSEWKKVEPLALQSQLHQQIP